jgi:hypothetical protein
MQQLALVSMMLRASAYGITNESPPQHPVSQQLQAQRQIGGSRLQQKEAIRELAHVSMGECLWHHRRVASSTSCVSAAASTAPNICCGSKLQQKEVM